MSFHHNFDHSDHAGFTRSIDAGSARRQLQVSLAVTAVLILAIGGSAFAVRPANGFDPRSQQAGIADAHAVSPHRLNADSVGKRVNGG